jgi:hypothetical protein
MQGIEELTNIMQGGGRSDVPMNMGAQPRGAPQGIESMMPAQDMAMMQQAPVEEEAQGMDLTNDGDALASAVVGRTNGDLQQALSILEEATNTIMQAAQQSEQPVMAAEGKPIPSGTEGAGLRALPDEVVERMGFVKAADGRPMTQTGIRGMSDEDLRTMLRGLIASSLTGQQGRVMSDKDLEFYNTMSGRRISDADRKRMRPSNKLAYGGDVKKMMGGGQMMKYADGGEMEEYNMGGEIIPFV